MCQVKIEAFAEQVVLTFDDFITNTLSGYAVSKSSNNPNRCFVSFNGFDTDNTSEIDCNLYKQTEF